MCNSNDVALIIFPSDIDTILRSKCASLYQVVEAYNNGLADNEMVYKHFAGITKPYLAIMAMGSAMLIDKNISWALSQLLTSWARW